MKSKILVVDDEESIRSTFRGFFEHEGYDVSTACDYPGAVELLEHTAFDLILTDIMLGGKTGVDVLRAVREQQPRCPVVMITGYPDVDTAEEAVRHGAFDYLRKPVTFENLMKVAERAVRHKQQTDEQARRHSTLRAILKSVTETTVAVDGDLRVLDVSGAESICGLRRDAEGRMLTTLVGKCCAGCVEILRRTLTEKRPIEGARIECGHADRAEQSVLVNAYPLLDSENMTTGGVLLIRKYSRMAGAVRSQAGRAHYFSLIGKSPAIQRIYSLLEALADVQTTVLITGESGTGKELVAQALHYGGSRAGKPLVKVNCAGLTESLLESELFGHVKGAFTGAIRDKIGRFQRADGGTIFLDEIGDITPQMQMRLLRVLQEREFERVGDSTPVHVDVRVVVATNNNLPDKVRQGKFREDLYYRLKVVELSLPPLRERREDIPLLTEHFIRKFNARFNREIEDVSPDVMGMFMEYGWPGNVRELEHQLEHAFIHCRGQQITVADLPHDMTHCLHTPVHRGSGLTEERTAVLHALEKSFWNKTRAAGILGVSRRTIYRKIKEYDIKRG